MPVILVLEETVSGGWKVPGQLELDSETLCQNRQTERNWRWKRLSKASHFCDTGTWWVEVGEPRVQGHSWLLKFEASLECYKKKKKTHGTEYASKASGRHWQKLETVFPLHYPGWLQTRDLLLILPQMLGWQASNNDSFWSFADMTYIAYLYYFTG